MLNSKWWCTLLVLVAGGMVPVQIALNTLAAKTLGKPLQATALSYFIGGFAAISVCFANRYSWPAASAISTSPVWVWFAGVLGMLYIWAVVYAAPRIGVALSLMAPAAGQMITAMFLDQTGAFGLLPRAISPERLLGLAFVLIGLLIYAGAIKQQ